MKTLYRILLALSGIPIAFVGLVLGSWIYQYNPYVALIAVPIGCFGFIMFFINLCYAIFPFLSEKKQTIK